MRRQGGWLPDNQDELEAWLAGHRERVAAKGEQVPLQPVVAEFQALIDSDPVVRMYFSEMVAQVPRNRQCRKRHLESVLQLLQLINEVLTMAPEYNEDAMVVLPLGAILDWTMGTPAGFAAFRDRRINAMFKKILGVWCEFLSSSDSRYVLNDSPSGWKGRAARRAIGIEQYQYDPGDEYWGFTSWNDFFTRCLCESTPYGLAVDVQRQDQFWLKSQPYSLQDMLANDESADRFVGGTVYQAFLSATNYHRWHSPVAGTIVRAFVQDGTYYSEPDSEGTDAAEPRYSQSYLAHVAARAVILIEADNPVIGLTAFVPVGMNEVSSCMIDPKIQPGYHVNKGEELGYFQFGGSTHCLVFRPGAIAGFYDPNPPLIRVRSKLATTF